MLISSAYAQDAADAMAVAPSPQDAFAWNMGLIVVLVAMFYLLLIRPQQKRFKEHTEMLNALKKGDRVVTGGGLVGKISKITEGSDEVEVDLGGMKVTALRSTISSKEEPVKTEPKTKAKASTKTKAKKS